MASRRSWWSGPSRCPRPFRAASLEGGLEGGDGGLHSETGGRGHPGEIDVRLATILDVENLAVQEEKNGAEVEAGPVGVQPVRRSSHAPIRISLGNPAAFLVRFNSWSNPAAM